MHLPLRNVNLGKPGYDHGALKKDDWFKMNCHDLLLLNWSSCFFCAVEPTWWFSDVSTLKQLYQILNIQHRHIYVQRLQCNRELWSPEEIITVSLESPAALQKHFSATHWCVLDVSLCTRSLLVGAHPAAFTHSLRIQWRFWNIQIRILILRASALCVDH